MPVTISKADNGKTFTLSPGDTLVIQLPENPTTGFRWKEESSDQSVLALQTSDFSAAPKAAVGGGGTRQLTLKGQKAGTAQVSLKLQRSWLGDSSTRDDFEVTVVVNSG